MGYPGTKAGWFGHIRVATQLGCSGRAGVDTRVPHLVVLVILWDTRVPNFSCSGHTRVGTPGTSQNSCSGMYPRILGYVPGYPPSFILLPALLLINVFGTGSFFPS